MVHAGEVLRAKGWRRVFTVSEMAEQWAWLVAKVESGCDMVDEYANDLCCRDWLAEAWPMLTHHLSMPLFRRWAGPLTGQSH